MRMLTLKQPWASLVAAGEKSIETRTWSTLYRGDILITASKSPVRMGMPVGVALCVVELVDVRPM